MGANIKEEYCFSTAGNLFSSDSVYYTRKTRYISEEWFGFWQASVEGLTKVFKGAIKVFNKSMMKKQGTISYRPALANSPAMAADAGRVDFTPQTSPIQWQPNAEELQRDFVAFYPQKFLGIDDVFFWSQTKKNCKEVIAAEINVR
ncbi:MAG: hypothetical protein PHV74_04780 [Dehalococcoidia bacterium]|nr:hypothetical protein [Dehalococcoidia bacterium]